MLIKRWYRTIFSVFARVLNFTGHRKAGVIAIMLCSLLVLFLMIIAPCEAESPKVGTLDALLQMYDPTECRECHEDIFSQWQTSHHARSVSGIFMDRYLKKGVLSVKSPQEATKENFPCFKCHFPQIEHAADTVAAEIATVILSNDRDAIRKLNISCLVCHRDKGIVHGPPKQGTLYGNQEIPDHSESKYMPVKRSPIMKQSVMCGQCHGLGPNLEFKYPVQCATLYGSYLHAYIPSGGTQTCQDCHMKNADHTCPPNFAQRDEVSARLKTALPLEVSALAYRFQPTENRFVPLVVVKTKITSKAGHRIPDG